MKNLYVFNRFVPVDLDCDSTRTGRRNDLSRCDGNGFAAAVVDDLSQQLRHQKNEELDRKIWKTGPSTSTSVT